VSEIVATVLDGVLAYTGLLELEVIGTAIGLTRVETIS
jgi:hypothetical protein